jgi:hypothetical protein
MAKNGTLARGHSVALLALLACTGVREKKARSS